MAFIAACLFAALPARSLSAQPTSASPQVIHSLAKELGDLRGNYVDGGNDRVSRQILTNIEGSDPPVALAGGNFFLSGCRLHSCDEKAAVIVTPDGTMLAAALINFHCQPVIGCLEKATLTILVKRKNNHPATIKLFQEWSDRMQAGADRYAYAKGFRKTEIRIIPEGVPR